jgi:hypothetical protein
LLVRYGILPKTEKVWLETAMTYKSYLALYLKAVYNITEDKTKKILTDTGLNPDSYVDTTYSSLLNTLISLRLSWVELPDYSPKTLKKFELLAQSTYRSEWKKIDEFEYSIYNGTKFWIDKVLMYDPYMISYTPYNSYVFDPTVWLRKYIDYNTQWSLSLPAFGYITASSQQNQLVECSKKPLMDKVCISFYKKLANTIIPSSQWSYSIVTLWDMLDAIKTQIDIGLFDPQWIDKK